MNKRLIGLTGIGLGVTMLAAGAMSVSAFDGSSSATVANGSTWSNVRSNVASVVGDIDLFETAVAPGTIDDGKELLPQATITLDEAIAAAQTTGDGALGEVDLEYFNDHLVFNIDIGNTDVKVDALDGTVLAALADE